MKDKAGKQLPSEARASIGISMGIGIGCLGLAGWGSPRQGASPGAVRLQRC